MKQRTDDPRITVLYAYFYAHALKGYYDRKLLEATLEKAKLHCLRTKQQQRLTLFSIVHAEISGDSIDSNSPSRRFISEHCPDSASWYSRIIDATTRRHHVEHHSDQLLIHEPSREHSLDRIIEAVEDDGGYLVGAIIAGVKRLPFHRILKAANVQVEG